MSVWATLALAIGNQLKGSAQHQKPKTKQQTPNGAVQWGLELSKAPGLWADKALRKELGSHPLASVVTRVAPCLIVVFDEHLSMEIRSILVHLPKQRGNIYGQGVIQVDIFSMRRKKNKWGRSMGIKCTFSRYYLAYSYSKRLINSSVIRHCRVSTLNSNRLKCNKDSFLGESIVTYQIWGTWSGWFHGQRGFPKRGKRT